ncbi:ribosomal protein S7 [Xylaria sp. CBS 124048]|nr:ribosomal protein S7 [Xylaria sp. CBS 124048]
MASKIINPRGSTLRSLSIRTRPVRPRILPIIAKRGYADDEYDRYDGYDHHDEYDQSPSNQPPIEPRPIEPFADNLVSKEVIEALEQAASGQDAIEIMTDGLRFDMPRRAGKHEQLQDRHHPVIHQVTRMLMRDGKLSQAQKHVSLILNHLRTSPPPKISPLRPLLPGSPPPEQLPLNPLLYLTLAIDSVGPIVRVRSLKGMAGGGAALDVPEPIDARARRRQAIQWIIDIVKRRPSMGSGRKQFATRFGQEIISVIEGRSSAWDRRQAIHNLSTTARANLSHPGVAGKKR